MPLTGVFLAVNYQHASALSPAIDPLPFETFIIVSGELTMTVLFVVRIPSLVERSVSPAIDAETVFFTVKETALVLLSIFVFHEASSRSELVLRKLSLILPLISTSIHSFAVLLSAHVLSFVC